MTFHDESLPTDVEYGSIWGGGFATIVTSTATGHEVRVGRQAAPRRRMRLVAELKNETQAAALRTFALARRGALHTFPVKDFGDFTSAEVGTATPSELDSFIATADGTTQAFQLVKTYNESLPGQLTIPITLPVADTVRVAIDGVEVFAWTLTRPGGIITFAAPPADTSVITAGFEFEVQGRFETNFDKWAGMRSDGYQVWATQDLEVVSVLDELEWPEPWFPGGVYNWGAVGSDVTLAFAQGSGHRFTPTTAINAFLPQPPTLFPGGIDLFAVHVTSGSAVQVRDHLGVAVGSSISAGNLRRFGAVVTGGSVTWFDYG